MSSDPSSGFPASGLMTARTFESHLSLELARSTPEEILHRFNALATRLANTAPYQTSAGDWSVAIKENELSASLDATRVRVEALIGQLAEKIMIQGSAESWEAGPKSNFVKIDEGIKENKRLRNELEEDGCRLDHDLETKWDEVFQLHDLGILYFRAACPNIPDYDPGL